MADSTNNGVSKTVTLLITAISQFLGPFTTAVNIALPSMGKDLSMSALMLGWTANSFGLALAVFLIPIGKLADIYGRKKVFIYGILLFTVASFLCGISRSVALLIVFRVFQGLGCAMTAGVSFAILTSVFPDRERGKAFGIAVAAVYLGLSLGPFLGGVLTQQVGWRSIFFLNAFLGLVVSILVLGKLKGEWADARGERFDFIGSVVLSFSLILILYGFSVLPQTQGIVLIVLGVLGMVAFARLEGRTENPVLNVELFRRNIVFVFSNLAALIVYCAIFALSFLLSLYLQYTKGFSPQLAGLILVAQPAVMTILAPFAGRLADRIDPRKVATGGMVVQFVGLLFFVFLTEATSIGFIIAGLAILGLGISFFSTPNMKVIMGSVEARFFGVASGVQATMRHGGQVLSIGIVLILFAIYIGQVEITPEYYPAFLISARISFIIFTVLCFGGIFAQLAGVKFRKK